MQLTHSEMINAPADQVWPTLSDITKWPEWTPTVKKVYSLDETAVGVGSRFKLYQPKLLPADWSITNWEPGVGFEWESKVPGVVTTASHQLKITDSGVEIQLIIEFSGPLGGLIGRITDELTKEYFSLEAAGLKRHCEDTSYYKSGRISK